MKKFIARQGIYNNKNSIYGYEILYRNSTENKYPIGIDTSFATKESILNSLFDFGFDSIANNDAILFFNLDEKLLEEEFIFCLPKKKICLELLETMNYNYLNLNKIKEIKNKGFMIALDDFLLDVFNKEYLPYCDIIKIDIQEKNVEKRLKEIKYYKSIGLSLIAEKIETKKEYDFCKKIGFDFFQGYYFDAPEILKTKSKYNSSKIQYNFNFDDLNLNNFSFNHSYIYKKTFDLLLESEYLFELFKRFHFFQFDFKKAKESPSFFQEIIYSLSINEIYSFWRLFFKYKEFNPNEELRLKNIY